MTTPNYPKLDPELAQYLEPMAGLGQMIRHPLVYSVPYFGEAENERLNERLVYLKRTIKKAQESGDHSRYVFMHERPYRFSALLELTGEIPDAEFLPLILEVYVDSENARENFDEWEDLLYPLTGTDPWNTLAALKEPITVYRGGVKQGFSWTTSLETAKWFAGRFDGTGDIWTATVAKSDIVAYYDGRNEREIIASYEAMRHLIDKYDH